MVLPFLWPEMLCLIVVLRRLINCGASPVLFILQPRWHGPTKEKGQAIDGHQDQDDARKQRQNGRNTKRSGVLEAGSQEIDHHNWQEPRQDKSHSHQAFQGCFGVLNHGGSPAVSEQHPLVVHVLKKEAQETHQWHQRHQSHVDQAAVVRLLRVGVVPWKVHDGGLEANFP